MRWLNYQKSHFGGRAVKPNEYLEKCLKVTPNSISSSPFASLIYVELLKITLQKIKRTNHSTWIGFKSNYSFA